jgi:dihydrofolate reductase
MRKLRVFESVSLDGYFTDASGDMSWAHSNDPEFGAFISQNAGSGGELLFGRKTYEMMAAFWPTPAAAAQMPAVAKGMNEVTKYVASRSLTKATWQNTKILAGDVVTAVRKLKATGGPDIAILGSGTIAAILAEASLVDEYQFVIVPIALGGGRTVFTQRQNLQLVEQRAFKNGNVVVTYAV